MSTVDKKERTDRTVERPHSVNGPDLIARTSRPISPEQEPWLIVAERVATALRSDVVERDRANERPSGEIELLRNEGLFELIVPKRYGGGGIPWSSLLDVVRVIARADSSIAHILGYHYTWLRIIESFDGSVAAQALRDTVSNRWLWASTGTSSTRLPILEKSGDSFTLTGSNAFATGATVANRLIAKVIEKEGRRLTAMIVDPHASGVELQGVWDVLGQRLSATSGIELDRLPLTESSVLAFLDPIEEEPTPSNTLSVLNFQLLFSVLHLGIAEGALLEAAEYTRVHTRPAPHSIVSSGREEPFILNSYGAYVAEVQAVSALVDRAASALDRLYLIGSSVTAIERAETAEIIASAKIVSTRVALEVSQGIFDLTGARATSTSYGLDRFWRNARTLSLHDPVAYKRDELGRYFINGDLPQPSGYR